MEDQGKPTSKQPFGLPRLLRPGRECNFVRTLIAAVTAFLVAVVAWRVLVAAGAAATVASARRIKSRHRLRDGIGMQVPS
jgi:hypothetical protein